jgi:hypothetical protein
MFGKEIMIDTDWDKDQIEAIVKPSKQQRERKEQ